uniref:L-aspartate oxidase n=1 Tax=uncultured organism TaxID=155900 RepID=M1QCD2_9ZZZZ|nr:L-aspartate oxidase [uncultured organism]
MITAGTNLDNGNTPQAQGGIIFNENDDSPELLQKDIYTAGWNCNYKKAVKHISQKGSDVVREILLDKLQIAFEKDRNGKLKLTREGGHSTPRILYCADYTGRSIIDGYIKKINNSPNINVITNRTAVDLLTSHHQSTSLEFQYQLNNQCLGAYVFNQYTREVETIMADFTILATGGVGQIFLHTTNSNSSIGSGVTMAHRSGAKTMNSEFVQFHPTALFQRGGQQFLISETVRGEGAKFIRMDGKPFMKEYDSRGDLAPRDIVTRATIQEMLKTGDDFVYLDAANYISKDLPTRFPTIYNKCLELGIDINKDPIPVVPAAHFFCGGILVDMEGKTTLNRLYAIGECSCTGVHGANRLASTSLLEGVLWGKQAAESIHYKIQKKNQLSKKLMESIPDWTHVGNDENEDPALITQDWLTIKNTMWNYVGIVRTSSRLRRAVEDFANLSKRLYEFYRNTPISKELIQLFHGCQTAILITHAARMNKKSQGCHYRPE